MTLAAGVLGGELQASGVRGATLVKFALSHDHLDETQLLESAYASPGRYVGEMFRRLRVMYPQAGRYLAANPYLNLGSRLVDALLKRAVAWEAGASEFAVFVDRRGRPLAYLFLPRVVDGCPPVHLGLLSTTDGRLDERLLRASFGPGRCVEISVLPPGMSARERGNDFWELSPVMRAATQRAAEVLEALADPAARQQMVSAGERSAVVGYHAGDVLFALQALALEQTNFRSLAVLSVYADIVAYVAPQLECLAVRQPVPHRPGHHVTDDLALLWAYVAQLEDAGTPPRFWHLFRPFRSYDRTRHHLREMMAFALGGRGHPPRPQPAVPAARRERQHATPTPGRVIVHFEGGWRLKEFPAERRGELVTLLREAGYDPVILGAPEAAVPNVPAVRYTDLDSFRAMLASAEGLVGCDSFPAHFSQLLGVPTVQLFGSTRPANSRGTESLRYRFLHHPLTCVPCGRTSVCDLDQGNSCQAQATSHEVLTALRELAPPPRAPADSSRPEET